MHIITNHPWRNDAKNDRKEEINVQISVRKVFRDNIELRC